MKKIKKIVYSCLFILVCCFGFSLSVFADTDGIAGYSYDTCGLNSKTGLYEKNARITYYVNTSDNSCAPFVIKLENDRGFYACTFAADTSTTISNMYLIDYVDDKMENRIFNGKDFKAISALSYFKNSYSEGNTSSKTFYNFLIDKCGYDSAEVIKVLSSFYIGSYSGVIGDYLNDKGKQNYTLNNAYSIEGIYLYMKSLLDQNKKPWEDKKNVSPPKFYLKTHNDNGLNKYTEYTLTWLTKGSFVEGKESEYGFKVFIGKERKPLEAKELEVTKYSPCKFTADKLVFTWENIKDLFSFLSTSSLENRFDVFIQITDKTGKAVSDNYIHFLVIKRVEIRESDYVDKNGNIIISYGKWENGQFKYTDGRETSSEDNSTNSNGSSTAPGSNVSNDDYTDISNAPSSSQIDASATNSLIKTLDTIVSSVSNVPALLAKVYAWLPYQIITLIGTAIGLIVVVGIIKWVL